MPDPQPLARAVSNTSQNPSKQSMMNNSPQNLYQLQQKPAFTQLPFDLEDAKHNLEKHVLDDYFYLELSNTTDRMLYGQVMKFVSEKVFGQRGEKKGEKQANSLVGKKEASSNSLRVCSHNMMGETLGANGSLADEIEDHLTSFSGLIPHRTSFRLGRFPGGRYAKKPGASNGKGSGMQKKNEAELKNDVECPEERLGIGWHSVEFEYEDLKDKKVEEVADKEVKTEKAEKKKKTVVHALFQRIGEPEGAMDGEVQLFESLIIFASKEEDGRQALLQLCRQAVQASVKKKPDQVVLFRWNERQGGWCPCGRRWARAIDSVVLDQKSKEKLLDDLYWFQEDNTRLFYAAHGIPYHRCYLFYGPPGSGKSSMIQALSGHLERHLCFLQASPSLTDDKFRSAMQSLPKGACLVMEDVDALFTVHREAADTKASLSFSGFLNALDGLAAPDDVVCFMTTNYADRLDPALMRPGRVDMRVEFKVPGKAVAKEYFLTFYPEDEGQEKKEEASSKRRKVEDEDNREEENLCAADKKKNLMHTMPIRKADKSHLEAAEKFGESVGKKLQGKKVSMAQLQHFFLACHRLGKSGVEAAEYVAEFEWAECGNGQGGAAGGGMSGYS